MSDFICRKCGYKTTDPVADCPQCKDKMLNSSIMRRQGRRQVLAGGCLAALMAILLVTLKVLSDENLTKHLAIPFAFGLGAGLTSIASGAWMIKYAKPNMKLILIMFVLILAMIFAMTIGRAMGQGSN